MISYAVLRPVFTYIIGPAVILGFIYYQGYQAGSRKVREEILESQKQISSSLRKAEEKNAEIRYEQDKKKIIISNASKSERICMFNAYFSGSSGNCYPKKADKTKD